MDTLGQLPRNVFTLSGTGDPESPVYSMLRLETPYDLLCCELQENRKTSNLSNAQPLLVIIRPLLTMIIMSMTVLRNKLSRYIIKSVIMF